MPSISMRKKRWRGFPPRRAPPPDWRPAQVRRDLLHDRRIAHVAQVDVELHQIAEAQALLSQEAAEQVVDEGGLRPDG